MKGFRTPNPNSAVALGEGDVTTESQGQVAHCGQQAYPILFGLS
jgi:hypothetical protein